ncbi:MAG: methyltransferase, partial [Actinomycetaceae bacterium]|nr:methyltransferase [Actinomycetaceae bacterium]
MIVVDDEKRKDFVSVLREDLRQYTPCAIQEELGAAYEGVIRHQRVFALRALRTEDTRLSYLIRALMLGDYLTEEEQRYAFPCVIGSNYADMLFAEDGQALYQIHAHLLPRHLRSKGKADYVLIASDWGEILGRSLDEHYVMPVSGATRSLMGLVQYKEGQKVLDIGTGNGIHAIIAALNEAHVVATDVSDDALQYAKMNAELAGVCIDFRKGSVYEPVDGMRFDVIVSNPPFVI